MRIMTPEEFAVQCHRFGWKCTPQRLAVYVSICGDRTHPDVDRVWGEVRDRLPTVTRESVYRILNEFSERGLVRRLDRVNTARYDADTTPHGHFICEKCGRITDFELTENPAAFIPATPPGRIRHTELRCIGLCSDCDKPNRGPRP